MSTTTGKVMIHGREYLTVALRVQQFREQCPAKDGWAITTEILERTNEMVLMKATIWKDSAVVATGHAEEKRKGSQILMTSALEVCETSAIGRALAAFGLCGSEYASADEVSLAIAQQREPQQRPQPSGRRRQPPKPSPEDAQYVTDTLQYIAKADLEDLARLEQDPVLRSKPEHVRASLRTAHTLRKTFLTQNQENPDAQNPQPQKG